MARGISRAAKFRLANHANTIKMQRRTYLSHDLYPPSKPLPLSLCSNAHHAAMRESLRPPNPFILLWAAVAASRSKKSNMILDRASLSTLRGMKVLNESRAMFESGI